MALGCFSPTSPNPNLGGLPLKKLRASSSMAPFSSSSPTSSMSFGLKSLQRRRRALVVAGVVSSRSGKKNFSIVSFAASQEDSRSEGEVEMEKNNLKQAGKASQESWEQALASFKEQALKLQSVSQEAYEVYSKKAVVILKDTAEQLKIQADQARQDLSVMAKELSKEGRQYLTTAAENSPEFVKDVVETFASADNLDDVSKVCDFYIGIPYGLV